MPPYCYESQNKIYKAIFIIACYEFWFLAQELKKSQSASGTNLSDMKLSIFIFLALRALREY